MSTPLKLVREDDFRRPPPLEKETGSSYGYDERMFLSYRDGAVFDYGDVAAREIEQMLRTDYRARQIESVLALPIMSAAWDIVPAGRTDAPAPEPGDDEAKTTPELDFLKGYWQADEMDPNSSNVALSAIIGQATSAFSYRRAFWEKVWTLDENGRNVFKDVAFRPQSTCRVLRHPRTGKLIGFEQDPYNFDPKGRQDYDPIRIGMDRALVYIHGQRLNPLAGTSDLEIAYWAWKSKQKLLFLWFQFLEGVSLPRVVVKSGDMELSRKVASEIARLKSSGILPVSTDGTANDVSIDPLDMSGKGSEEFTKAIEWLDNAATDSVLASFLNLTGGTGNGGQAGGSYALAKDASDFFLQLEEAKSREIEWMVRNQLFAPMIRHNFGPKATVPRLKFEPLNAEDKSVSVELLKAIMAMRDPVSIPDGFVGALARQVANYVGLDGESIEQEFAEAADEARKIKEDERSMAKAQFGMGLAGQATPSEDQAEFSTVLNKAMEYVLAYNRGKTDTIT